MSFWGVVFIVLMILWFVLGISGYDKEKGWQPLGNAIIPWACVAILGYCFFAGTGVVVIR